MSQLNDVIYLECSCCGMEAHAYKQSCNHDIGYGICSNCAQDIAIKYGEGYLKETFGIDGIHYFYKVYSKVKL